MKSEAVSQARNALERAIEAASLIDINAELSQSERAWGDFLMYAGRVYSKLEQGSKSNPKSLSWYGRKKHERRKDPLLRYIHHARNTEEHGLESITQTIPSEDIWATGPSWGGRSIVRDGVEEIEWVKLDYTIPAYITTSPYLELVTIFNSNYGDKFEPPETHLGETVDGKSPKIVADLAIGYLSNLLDEAKLLVV